jgi:hypothetical protein
VIRYTALYVRSQLNYSATAMSQKESKSECPGIPIPTSKNEF